MSFWWVPFSVATMVLHIRAAAFGTCVTAGHVVFCGVKKSLAAGIPLAHVLIPAATISLVVLPLMLFHQIQLLVCAVVAGRYARTTADSAAASLPQPVDRA